ncbi:MAG: glycosyltransferase family 2 protein [Bacteroidota bacterium]
MLAGSYFANSTLTIQHSKLLENTAFLRLLTDFSPEIRNFVLHIFKSLKESLKPDIDIIIISYNCAQLTLACIESVFKTHETARVTIVDNASTDNSPHVIREKFPEIQIIENKENRGYAGAVNIGMNATNAEFAIISNADVEFFENSIDILKNVLKENLRIGAAGPQQVFPNGKWQRSFGDPPGIGEAIREIFMLPYVFYSFKKLTWKRAPGSLKSFKKISFKNVRYIDGAVIAVRRDAFKDVGAFDEDFFFYAEEADFCLRLQKKKWEVVTVSDSVVLHHRGGSSTKSEVNEKFYTLLIESKMKLARKHYPQFAKLYAQLEIFHSNQMIFLSKFLKAVTLGRFKSRAEKVFTIQKAAFKKELKASGFKKGF